jgi:hypothetical protein
MTSNIFHFILFLFIFPTISYSQIDSSYHWSVKLQGFFGQTTGPQFSANGAGYGVAYNFELSDKSKLRLEHNGASLRGDVFTITDVNGSIIGTGRQAFYRMNLNALFHQAIWVNSTGTQLYIALGPGITYVSESTFSEINNEDVDGPNLRATGLNTHFELGLDLDQFIFSTFYSKSYYKESADVLDTSIAYLGVSAGYKF